MTTMIKTTLERELYDALQDMNRVTIAWFNGETANLNGLPYDWQDAVQQSRKAIDKADGKKMGKIEMIKHARAVSGMGLKESKDLVELILENAPDLLTNEPSPGFDRYGYRIAS